ncbi:MAG: hypothetical protein EON60_05770 [Alphaproteobacteria bacterium]|nr:MAG: hypothetical protein EON60_05770 [Alphaproteobacteria bacterium]
MSSTSSSSQLWLDSDFLSSHQTHLRRWQNRLPWMESLVRLFTRNYGDYGSFYCDWDAGRLNRFRRFIFILNRNTVAMTEAMRQFNADAALQRLWRKLERLLLTLAEAFSNSNMQGEVAKVLPSHGGRLQ